MKAIDLLLNASRPYKTFTVDINGVKVPLLARKPGALDAAKIGEAWNTAYEAAMSKAISKENVDTDALYRNLQRQDNDRLAEYISKADRLDMVGDAQLLCGDKPADSPEVQAKLDEMQKARYDELVAEPREQLISMAFDRRNHIHGLLDAQAAANRVTVMVMVYDADQSLAFESEEQVKMLPEKTIEEILAKASEALEEPEASPLTSAA